MKSPRLLTALLLAVAGTGCAESNNPDPPAAHPEEANAEPGDVPLEPLVAAPEAALADQAESPEPSAPLVLTDAEQRLAKLAQLDEELDFDGPTSWMLFDGCPRVPTIPAAMTAVGTTLVLATENRIERWSIRNEVWSKKPFPLPFHVGSGVNIQPGPGKSVYVVAGGDTPTLALVSLEDGSVTPVLDAPEPLGRGAALIHDKGKLFLAPGRGRDESFSLEAGGTEWKSDGRIGRDALVETGFGFYSGFLVKLEDAIYGLPDHHTQKFDLALQAWERGTWLAIGFRPSWNGGGVTSDDRRGSFIVAAGMYSRSLNEVVPVRQRGVWYFLSPRLPYPMIGEGDRLAIAPKKRRAHLFAYAIEPDNRLCALPLADLVRLDAENNVADVGSPWRRIPTEGGGSGVRRRVELGERSNLTLARGTMGVMGSLEGELFFMRLAYARRIDPITGLYSFYPGHNIGRHLALGASGVHDGDRYLYMTAGRTGWFVRWELPDGPPEQREFKEERRPVKETDFEVLPEMPVAPGNFASLSYLDGVVYSVAGGGSREFFAYRPDEAAWTSLAPIPDEAPAPGEVGSGVATSPAGVFVALDDQVWRYDPAGDEWSRFGTLGFALGMDGGMVCGDGGRHLYAARGDISTRLGRLDLETGAWSELSPGPPDVVSAEGNRLAVITVEGEERLFVHRGHNSNELLWIPVAELQAR